MDLGVLVLWLFAAIGFFATFTMILGIVYTSFRAKYNPADKINEALYEIEKENEEDKDGSDSN